MDHREQAVLAGLPLVLLKGATASSLKSRVHGLASGNPTSEVAASSAPVDSRTSSLRTPMSTLGDLLRDVVAFRDERDWGQFHTPKNLAAALAIEASEIQEELLWKTDKDVGDALTEPDSRQRLEDEIADVLIYALLLCDSAGVEPSSAIRAKLRKNAAKYPVDLAHGNAQKYTDFDNGGGS